MASSKNLSLIASISSDQWGLITRSQALDAGIAPSTLDRLTADDAILERVTHGVYHVRTAPLPESLELRAAWLQLAPATTAWDRRPDQGVVSHRSAAAVLGLGQLPADEHEFTFPGRRQSRRPDVVMHILPLPGGDWMRLGGLIITTPSRIVGDLLRDHEDPENVAQLISESLRRVLDYRASFVQALAPLAARYGLEPGDGEAMTEWLLGCSGGSVG